MGYDISLKEDNIEITLNNDETFFGITYNYAELYSEAFGSENGIRSINGLKYPEGLKKIKSAIASLSDENLGPTIEELKTESEKYSEIIRKNSSRLSYSEDVFYDLLQRNVHKRLATADWETGRAKPTYWDATSCNAKKALQKLVELTANAPKDSIWSVE